MSINKHIIYINKYIYILASVTINISKMFTVVLYFANASLKPKANASIILAANVTTNILESDIRYENFIKRRREIYIND